MANSKIAFEQTKLDQTMSPSFDRRQILLGGAGLAITTVIPGCGKSKPKVNQKSSPEVNPRTPPPILGWEILRTDGESPGPRSRHGLVYNPLAKTVILFGGVVWDEDDPYACGDTWELNGKTWREIDARISPPPRFRSGMVFLNSSNRAFLFGGFDRDWEALGDSWFYSNQKWQRVNTAGKPAPSKRGGHCMVFDETAKVAVLFGGLDNDDNTLDDTWTFDGNAWKKIEGPAPDGRRYASLAYHPGLGGCLLHGGAFDDNGDVMYGDAWLFKDQEWSKLPERYETSERDDHGLIYHHIAKQMVMLEGVSGERGILALGDDGWKMVDANPLHPRHQATPLVWHVAFNGVLMYGGEEYHGGPQFDTTMILHMPRGK